MARHDDAMDAFATLLGLGVLGSLHDPKESPDFEKFKAEAEAKRKQYQDQAMERTVAYAERDAKMVRAIYEAYIKVGFTEQQSFELVKAGVSNKSK